MSEPGHEVRSLLGSFAGYCVASPSKKLEHTSCLVGKQGYLDFYGVKIFLAALGEPNWLTWMGKVLVACAS